MGQMISIASPVVKEVTSAEVGFAGPIGLKEGVRILIEERAASNEKNYYGANETDHHIKNVNSIEILTEKLLVI